MPSLLDCPDARCGSGSYRALATPQSDRMAQVLPRRTNDGAALGAECRRLLDRIFEWLVSRLGLRAQRTPASMTTQPLTPMVDALQALIEQQRALDRRELEDPDEDPSALERRETNIEAIDHLERAIACLDASHARDALAQVLIAPGRTISLEQDTCERSIAGELEVVSRLLRSALPVLAQQAEVDLETFGGDHYGLGGPSARSTRRPSAAPQKAAEPDCSAGDEADENGTAS